MANLPLHNPGPPPDSAINGFSDPTISGRLLKVKDAGINHIRNKVFHQLAYRPTRNEFETALAEARDTLLPLTRDLDISDDANYYLCRPKGPS